MTADKTWEAIECSLKDRNGKRPTKKQVDARRRNWAVKQLRAFFHIIPPPVSSKTREKIQRLIDREIMRYGAESEVAREKKRREALEASCHTLDKFPF